MACNKKGEGDLFVAVRHHSPQQVLQHSIVLVLPGAIVCMEVALCFFEAKVLKKKVQQTNDSVRSFAGLNSLIKEEQGHLWNGFSHHTEDSALSGSFEVDGAWLLGV